MDLSLNSNERLSSGGEKPLLDSTRPPVRLSLGRGAPLVKASAEGEPSCPGGVGKRGEPRRLLKSGGEAVDALAQVSLQLSL